MKEIDLDFVLYLEDTFGVREMKERIDVLEKKVAELETLKTEREIKK